ncbi:hypothetical protein EWB00_009390 [Schistosoma japonicum]|uniref:Proteasome assembly chaperone 3 n=1 Tax=Schistosoma japonicum TaxID=6182 RepID=A0A4Z2DSJ3_SCHJA|nr:hypothetical protein KSF78_0003488 [Schistosoma japonicum]KAH8866686.1 hypothetical protein KSF78_0003488 [Schistosoma japonicum]KAH8866687.1 hypothetical protein KSF78_0003488 [Schistosoma japonicum]TNN19170.1 hypothetical protein EWB00_009390 [Schistosoma japonicum]
MKLPSVFKVIELVYINVFKSTLQLPVAGFTVSVVLIEFSDHLMILISRNGKIGDIVLSQKNNLPGLNSCVSHVDARTLFGPEKINTCLITRQITKALDTPKTILLSTDFKEDICFSDTQLICYALENIRHT